MDIQSIIYFMFAAVLLASAIAVVTVPNPVHSALFLIVSFFSAAGIWIMLQAEFLGILLILVYVGMWLQLWLPSCSWVVGTHLSHSCHSSLGLCGCYWKWLRWFCFSCGYVRPSHVIAMIKSCVWVGRCSCRCAWFGCLWSVFGCTHHCPFGNNLYTTIE